MITNRSWIRDSREIKAGDCPVFVKKFNAKDLKSATLDITAKGVYYATLNGKRVGNFIMAPGYTQYSARLQYQSYDITSLICEGENTLEVTLSAGWYAGRITYMRENVKWDPEIIAELTLCTKDGEKTVIGTDESWLVGYGPLIFSDIYDGEIYDANKSLDELVPVEVSGSNTSTLIEQEGEDVVEQERFLPCAIMKTPKGETVIDFGQNLTGYPVLTINAKAGETVSVSFAESLDKDGNFYNENYRSAICQYKYVCKDGKQTFKPRCTFYGFRYIRIDEFPASATLDESTFTAVAVYSKMKQTGSIATSDARLNQLISNIFWGQRCNYLDVPTDCPQRDERLGWTGDAQVFCKTATYNYDVERFFKKWLLDVYAYYKQNGYVGFFIPGGSSQIAAGWSDAAVIIPWQIYLSYGDREFLEKMLDMMVDHVNMLERESEKPNAWYGGKNLRQFGDWLATDSLDKDRDGAFVETTYSGASNPDLIQSAFYAYDLQIVAKALEVLGRDGSEYRERFEAVREQFRRDFPVYNTQTECILALRFDLAENREETLSLLVRKIRENGNRMSTGFIGTPHILHALSENGRHDLAYTLLLQREYPSWLYCVDLGATTMWEHWDSINLEGELWRSVMNSFNHYAYGAVGDWLYEVAAGIKQEKDSAGFEKLVVEPHPDKRIGWLEATYDTRRGEVKSKWSYTADSGVRYDITVPADAKIVISGKEHCVKAGSYVFFERI